MTLRIKTAPYPRGNCLLEWVKNRIKIQETKLLKGFYVTTTGKVI